MSTSHPIFDFRKKLEQALDSHHPGWDVRRRATWHPDFDEQWQQNRRFSVWVDTLKRWVRGENFPREKRFFDFLENTEFPDDLQQELLRLYQVAKKTNKSQHLASLGGPSNANEVTVTESSIRVAGRPPLGSTRYFVGRATHLAELEALLGNKEVRIVSVIGPNGIGKTALACHLLERVQRGDSLAHLDLDGILYLDTQHGELTLDKIATELATILEEKEAQQLAAHWRMTLPTHEKIKRLVEALDDLSIIILLDGLEKSLYSDGGWIDQQSFQRDFFVQTLTKNAHVQFILTSQVGLWLPQEVEYLSRLLDLDIGLTIDEGLKMLRDLDPNGLLGLQAAPASLLVEAVTQVQGVPQALEDLVTILEENRLVSLPDVLNEFSTFRNGQTHLRPSTERWDEITQQVVQALSIYHQPMPLEAIMALLPHVSPQLVRASLQKLLRSRLVVGERRTGLIAIRPIDRAAVYKRLPEATRQEFEWQAANYILANTPPKPTPTSLDDLQPQITAFQHYIRAQHFDLAFLTIQPYLAHFLAWGMVDHVILWLGYELADKTLNIVRQLALARAYHYQWRLLTAYDHYEAMLPHLAELNDQQATWMALAEIALYLDRPHQSRQWIAQLKSQPESDKPYIQPWTIIYAIERLPADSPQIPEALIDLDLAPLSENQQLLYHVEMAQAYLARPALPEHYPERVRQHLVHADELDIDDRELLAQREVLHARLWHAQGQIDDALEALEEALHLLRQTNNLYLLGHCLIAYGQVLANAGRELEARDAYAESITLASAQETIPRLLRSALLAQALQACRSGYFEQAHQTLEHLMPLLQDSHEQWQWVPEWPTILELLLTLGKLQKASAWIDVVQSVAVDVEKLSLADGYGLALMGIVLARIGHTTKANAVFDQALHYANSVLINGSDLWQPRYLRALAWTGLALLADGDSQATALTHAGDAYQDAIQFCDAEGIVVDALRLLAELAPLDNAENLEPLRRLLTE